MSVRPFKIAKTASDKGWAIRHWRGYVYLDTIRWRRRDAIHAFIDIYGKNAWEERGRRVVHRAVKVHVTEIQSVRAIRTLTDGGHDA